MFFTFNYSIDEYFVSNIEKVDSVTLLRKDKVMSGVSWSLRFQQSISTWPCTNDLGSAAVQVLFIYYSNPVVWLETQYYFFSPE